MVRFVSRMRRVHHVIARQRADGRGGDSRRMLVSRYRWDGCSRVHTPTARNTPAMAASLVRPTVSQHWAASSALACLIDAVLRWTAGHGVCGCDRPAGHALIALLLAARRANVHGVGERERACSQCLGVLSVLSVVVRGAQAQALPSEIGLAALMHASQPPSPR